jgi:hypothetical protein
VPYWGLRSYSDNGEHYDGQIGSEGTPQEYVAALLACTAEWVRVLKPAGSLFVNLGDKYSNGGRGYYAPGSKHLGETVEGIQRADDGFAAKTLLGLPWRYALGCIDDLGLILRAEICWSKPNGLPESVADRVRRSHEQIFHLTRNPRYYSAVDEIREDYGDNSHAGRRDGQPSPATAAVQRNRPMGAGPTQLVGNLAARSPLGKIPGSVWEIPSQPLIVPASLGLDHFAAFPMELPRRIISGFSPSGICTACGCGRRPVTVKSADGREREGAADGGRGLRGLPGYGDIDRTGWAEGVRRTITGYVCSCTPYTDHPGIGKRELEIPDHWKDGPISGGGFAGQARDAVRTGPWREYHLDRWDAPPTRPAIVLDPFAGTGTTLLVAAALGRHAIGVDRSADYCRLATWRTSDPAERAKAMQVPKPPPVPDGQDSLFDLEAS